MVAMASALLRCGVSSTSLFAPSQLAWAHVWAPCERLSVRMLRRGRGCDGSALSIAKFAPCSKSACTELGLNLLKVAQLAGGYSDAPEASSKQGGSGMDSGGPKGWTHEPAWETGRTRARGVQKVMWPGPVTNGLACSVGCAEDKQHCSWPRQKLRPSSESTLSPPFQRCGCAPAGPAAGLR